MSSSGLAYPDRFYAAAAYAGFGPGASAGASITRFQNDVALLLYGLYQQATVGPCNVPKPKSWSLVEQGKWTSWHGLENMASSEAMRLFVKILEEEEPGWYSRVPTFAPDPVVDVEMHKPNPEPVHLGTSNGFVTPEPKTISVENTVTEDKDVIAVGLSSIGTCDRWTQLPVGGQPPRTRYEHGSTALQEKMYIFGGNHNGRYLNDLQVFDLKSLSWSRIEAKEQTADSAAAVQIAPCAGHSLIKWQNKIISVGGHTKNPSESIVVKEFDPQTCIWSTLKTYGEPPASRGGQSVTVVGTTLVMFGGEDAKRSLLNDLHILDLESMTWDDIDAIGTPPSPRSGHVAASHADRYLFIFGGGSHATCFNDLHVLDIQTMEWSRPKQQGVIPTARAGHAGVAVGENWYIAGGGNNTTGVSETLVLNMSTLVWSVVTSVQGRVPLASEGMSLVWCPYNGEDYLLSFGGYNGRYSNEVHVLKLARKSDDTERNSETAVSVPGSVSRDKPEVETSQHGKVREIAMDNVDAQNLSSRNNEANERLLAALKSEKDELQATLDREQMVTLQLRQDLSDAESRNAELTKELQSVRGQLATEQSRCFKLEVDVAELRQKLQAVETLQKELELLQRQKAASEQAALEANEKQNSRGGMWSWLVGTPQDKYDE